MPANPAHLTGPVRGGRKFYHQLLDMQDQLYTQCLADNTKPADRAACARSWEVLEERKRIMRGRPLPGSFRPTDTPKRKPVAAVPVTVYPPPANASAPTVLHDSHALERKAE